MPPTKALGSKNEYKIGWITALDKEQAAAIALLDERHTQPLDFVPSNNDDNVYNWGFVSGHNVVIVCLPDGEYGLTNATTTTERLRSSLPHIKIGLLLGIGAGIPESGIDIRLGDIAVSRPEGTTGGVIQYDFGKERQHGYERIGMLDRPPRVLLNALKSLRSEHELQESEIPIFLEKAAQRHPRFALNYAHPGPARDSSCQVIVDGEEKEAKHTLRADHNPIIHYGTILSGNNLVKSAAARRQIFEATGKAGICLEMEAAGLMNNFPCLVIRGICDYADSGKNDDWQRYASATAAAFAKELLLYVPKTEIDAATSITQVLGDLDSHVKDLTATFNQAEQRADDKEVSKFMQKLYSHAHAERKDRNPKRIGGTCRWFTEHHLFQDWNNGMGSQTLWVSADPGCGKSVLARYLVDEILPQQNRTICYFFFKDDFSDQKATSVAARTILHQLFNAHLTAITSDMMKLVNTRGEKIVESFKELWCIFLQAAESLNGEIVCVFDALDECKMEDRGDIIEAVCGGVSFQRLPPRVKVLALSRPYFHIRNYFNRIATTLPILHLSGDNDQEREQISVEIDLVIRYRIKAFCGQRKLDQKDHDVLLEELVSVPQKTYLWAHLTMSFIEDTRGFTRGHVRQLCKQLPLTVDAAYEKILERSANKTKTKILLQILIAAVRPFTVQEMCVLLALDGTQTEYSQLEDFIEPEDRFKSTLRELCGLFVIVVDSQVYLLHQTAREFLLEEVTRSQASGNAMMPKTLEVMKIDTVWKQSISLLRSNRQLVELCVWFWILSDDKIEHLSELYRYCINYWLRHLEESDVKSEDELMNVIHDRLLTDTGRCWSWFDKSIASQWSDRDPEYSSPVWKYLVHDTSTFPLKMACHMGLSCLTEPYLNGRWKQDWSKETLSQALWYALRSHSISTTAALIQAGADLNNICSPAAAAQYKGDLQFPLYLAAKLGHIDIVRLFLQHSIEVNSFNQDGGTQNNTPLHISLGQQDRSRPVASLDLAMLLVNYGADLRIKNSKGESPWALFYSNHRPNQCSQTLRELLCKEEANNPDRHEDNLRTPLSYVAQSGCMACLKNLLKRDASINFQDKISRTPLHYAMERHSLKIVTRLLSAGADVNARDVDGRTVLLLYVGTSNWDTNTFRLLIDAGANAHDTLVDGSTCLHEVCTSEGVQELVACGLNVNSRNKHNATPLISYASRSNQFTIAPRFSTFGRSSVDDCRFIRTMLQHGADLDALDDQGNSALIHYCARHRYEHHYRGCETVLSMLYNGNSTTIQRANSYGSTALHLLLRKSSCRGCLSFLLKNGAPVNAQDCQGNTPLAVFVATSSCRLDDMNEVTNLLIQAGADINRSNKNGDTPLLLIDPCRSDREIIDLIGCLLSYGANINAQNVDGTTLLMNLSTFYAYPSVLSFMLENGADPTVECKDGLTAFDLLKDGFRYEKAGSLAASKLKACIELLGGANDTDIVRKAEDAL